MPQLSEEQLSFARYVFEHKRKAALSAREGAAYAFGPEMKSRLRLGRFRPVALALELGLNEFAKTGRASVLDGAIEVSSDRFSDIAVALSAAAKSLGVEVPRAFISPTVAVQEPCVFGTASEPLVVLPAVFADHMSAPEMQATLASALGRIHNQHQPLITTLWMLNTDAASALRWAAKPATLWLQSWAGGADLTADRAALLVTRNFDCVAAACAKRLGGGRRLMADIDVAEALQNLTANEPPASLGLDKEDWRRWNVRMRALLLFANTAFFRGGAIETNHTTAMTMAECNDKAAALLETI